MSQGHHLDARNIEVTMLLRRVAWVAGAAIAAGHRGDQRIARKQIVYMPTVNMLYVSRRY